ncbi:hypothetical protein DPMN_103577 [Dreissena polymorpha]|uniref:Uncharacterized protein n=1 Tax=Dreissena polymorpha TaxID=45954 RepID=A0A9D4H8B3_DREPO|nr:hypothetical protein DPMN_103577 [Dreissena polymorpha]
MLREVVVKAFKITKIVELPGGFATLTPQAGCWGRGGGILKDLLGVQEDARAPDWCRAKPC